MSKNKQVPPLPNFGKMNNGHVNGHVVAQPSDLPPPMAATSDGQGPVQSPAPVQTPPAIAPSDEEDIAEVHSDEMQDIITAVPSWLLRFGISLFFTLLLLIVTLSSLIHYPDTVDATLTINLTNSPKPIVAKTSGKLVRLLVKNQQTVKKGDPLAFIESTANHTEVLALLNELKLMQGQIDSGKKVENAFFSKPNISVFGELQSNFQTFYQEYLNYCASVENGFYIEKKNYLQKDRANLDQQAAQLNNEKLIQQRDLELAEQEFKIYQSLVAKKAASPAELRTEESKYLEKKSAVTQINASIIAENTNYLAKKNEILELDNQINQEKAKFAQALNTMISQTQDWLNKYVLTASQSGKLSYAGIIQENQVLSANQDVFYVDAGNDHFFGEMMIPQNRMGKVMEGQKVLIKLRSYPFEEYGMLKGNITYISGVPFRDSAFLSRVDFRLTKRSDMKLPIHLRQGMLADAEIVIQNATILQRVGRDIAKIINNK
ncbi:MAG: HlyD family secretion protein [Mucilaginibacter sp.]